MKGCGFDPWNWHIVIQDNVSGQYVKLKHAQYGYLADGANPLFF